MPVKRHFFFFFPSGNFHSHFLCLKHNKPLMTQSTIFNGFMELEVYILGTNHERIRSQISDIYRTAKLQENINQSH